VFDGKDVAKIRHGPGVRQQDLAKIYRAFHFQSSAWNSLRCKPGAIWRPLITPSAPEDIGPRRAIEGSGIRIMATDLNSSVYRRLYLLHILPTSQHLPSALTPRKHSILGLYYTFCSNVPYWYFPTRLNITPARRLLRSPTDMSMHPFLSVMTASSLLVSQNIRQYSMLPPRSDGCDSYPRRSSHSVSPLFLHRSV
jgi:hypothetical protein